MDELKKERVLLGYYQLPSNYSIPLSGASEEKMEILSSKFSNAFSKDESHIVYVQGTAQPIYSLLPKKIGGLDVWGIDFVEYFKNVFEKSGEYKVIAKKYVFIYNVGLEPAVNTSFSSKLLKGIIKKLEMANSWVFIESDIVYQKFHTQYDIDIQNKIYIPLKKGKNFL